MSGELIGSGFIPDNVTRIEDLGGVWVRDGNSWKFTDAHGAPCAPPRNGPQFMYQDEYAIVKPHAMYETIGVFKYKPRVFYNDDGSCLLKPYENQINFVGNNTPQQPMKLLTHGAFNKLMRLPWLGERKEGLMQESLQYVILHAFDLLLYNTVNTEELDMALNTLALLVREGSVEVTPKALGVLRWHVNWHRGDMDRLIYKVFEMDPNSNFLGKDPRELCQATEKGTDTQRGILSCLLLITKHSDNKAAMLAIDIAATLVVNNVISMADACTFLDAYHRNILSIHVNNPQNKFDALLTWEDVAKLFASVVHQLSFPPLQLLFHVSVTKEEKYNRNANRSIRICVRGSSVNRRRERLPGFVGHTQDDATVKGPLFSGVRSEVGEDLVSPNESDNEDEMVMEDSSL